jgi:hypothetical protein
MVVTTNGQVALVAPIVIDIYMIPYIILHTVTRMQLRYNWVPR